MSRSVMKKIIRFCTSVSRGSKRDYHHQRISNVEIQKKRVELFNKEEKRQNALITDVHKIEVQYVGLPEECTLIMNKDLSTPYNCAQHINKFILDQSVLAEVDGEPWDMFRPLVDNCRLSFLHFKEEDPFYVNKAFWRSLSIMLGSVIEVAFKNDVNVNVCSFPSPNVRTGSFIYDVDLGLEDWKPTKDELRVFSSDMVRLALSDTPFHRLEVDAKLALEIFAENKYKSSQIPYMASESKSGNTVVIYKVADYLDISRGPLMGHTRHMGKCSIAAILPIDTDVGSLYRFQGVALPKDFKMNHFTYNILEERARRLNNSRFPSLGSQDKVVSQEQNR